MEKKLKDKEGKVIADSLVEKTFIEIGGIQQGFFIRTENPKNPVILFLHGGPGGPEINFIISHELPERLEKYFTVCYWEQRGAGISFSSLIDSVTMNVEQMVEDTHELTKYLQHRFEQNKLCLMGHSWGSYLGIKTIEKYPTDYLAFIGFGQVTNQLKSEKLAYDYMLQYAMKINDKTAVKKLQKFDINSSIFLDLNYILSTRTRLMNKYGIGMARKKFSVIGLIKNLFVFKGYTVSEKVNFIRGSLFSIKHLWGSVIADNLFESSTNFQVPIFILQGKYDYQTSYMLAREYFEKIKTPEKAFFVFENSAHSPNIEEGEKFVEIIRNIILKINER